MIPFAQTGLYGTKLDGAGGAATAASTPFGWMQILQLLIALGVVAALVSYVLPRVLGRLTKAPRTTSSAQARIESIGSLPGATLYAVEARGKTLLLAAGPGGVTYLTDLPTNEAGAVAFVEMLDDAATTPDREEALRRLERLAG